MKFSALKNENIKSPLESSKVVRPKSGSSSRVIAAGLILTSLVDAFSILVIYLLFNSSNGAKETQIHKEIHLPKSAISKALSEGVGIQVINSGYIFNDNKLSGRQLQKALINLGKRADRPKSLIVQADKDIDFDRISPILSIASEAGFEEIKFATIGGGS